MKNQIKKYLTKYLTKCLTNCLVILLFEVLIFYYLNTKLGLTLIFISMIMCILKLGPNMIKDTNYKYKDLIAFYILTISFFIVFPGKHIKNKYYNKQDVNITIYDNSFRFKYIDNNVYKIKEVKSIPVCKDGKYQYVKEAKVFYYFGKILELKSDNLICSQGENKK